MSRLIRILEQCLPAFACISGAVVSIDAIDAFMGDRPEPAEPPVPGFDAQAQEIADFVLLQEQGWRRGQRAANHSVT